MSINSCSAPPGVRVNELSNLEQRPVLGAAANKIRSNTKISATKHQRRLEKPKMVEVNGKQSPVNVSSETPQLQHCVSEPSILRHLEQLSRSNLSMSASCSSDASSDSSHSRSSTGRLSGHNRGAMRRKQCTPKAEVRNSESCSSMVSVHEAPIVRKRCAWITPNTDPLYTAFHDEEWGTPVHNDKLLFELLSFSGALAEIAWPTILQKRHLFREVFLDFDPIAVSKLNEKKITMPGSISTSLLSEAKLRGIIENARRICKIREELGSFDKYIWSFFGYKPTLGRFRQARQVPVKTPKAELISKDMVRRGLRSVGPTVIYSFMQASGMTNDHLVGCFRFHECSEAAEKQLIFKQLKSEKPTDEVEWELGRAMDDLSFSSDSNSAMMG